MSLPLDRVLLIDDDPDDAFLMQRALLELEWPVHFHAVEDCDEVLPALTLHQPQIIFLDVNMPKRNGLECLQSWQDLALLKQLPIVVYSSSGQQRLVSEAYRLGASLYLQKPNTFSDLIGSLAAILSLDWSNPATVRARYQNGDASATFSMA